MPTTTGKATDLITFSRGSLATVTDSNGYIKWAPHNLLLASEQFDSASWEKTSVTVTANYAVAPNGTTTADRAVYVGSLGTPTTRQLRQAVAISTSGLTTTFGVWVSGTGKFRIQNVHGGVVAIYSSDITATATPTLYTLTVTNAANAGNGFQVGGICASTTDDAFDLNLWGAHLYSSDLGGMQANASAYPYYNPSTPKNLLGFTELLTTGWTNTNTTDTQVAVPAPNGSPNSIDVAATAGNGTLLASLSLLASPYTFSIWLKRKTGTGTVEITVDGTTYVTAAVTSDWQRFSATLTPSAGTKTPGIRLVTSGDAVYAWGAQLSDSASLEPYVPNFGAAPSAAAAHGPRLDYDPVTLAAKGLLVEEQRTNLLTNSNDFTQWTNFSTSDARDATGPDGTTSATTLTNTSSGNASIVLSVAQPAGTQTLSAFVKQGTSAKVSIVAQNGGLANWAVATLTFSGLTVATSSGGTGYSGLSADVQPAGNGFYRLRLTYTLAASVTDTVQLFAGQLISVVTGETAIFYGAQLEAGAFATSYIPTAASTVTRNTDAASVGVSQFPYSATEGTIVAKCSFVAPAQSSPSNLVALSNGSSYESLYIYRQNSQISINVADDGGAVQASWTLSAPTDLTTAALAYKQNDFGAALNGVAQTSDTSGTVPTVDRMQLGPFWNGVHPASTWIRQITYIPRRLTNAELQARTT